jgi:phytoene/squalene synthetase
MDFYNETVMACSKLITNRYSTSFSMGIKSLDKRYHASIYAIYGFVRFADEIVDTFHNHNKAQLLERFTNETYTAIAEGISLNPVLQSFQLTVNKYKIEHELIAAFLHSMAMDLELETTNENSYSEYIYGSAEVVGLMCLRVFCEGNEAEYDRLKESGRKLGAAFQKVNVLRDMQSDFEERGRVYFPGANFLEFDLKTKQEIEADIKADFDAALVGIKELPAGAKEGVYMAYIYYLALFQKIKKIKPERILKERIRVPDFQKLMLMGLSYAKLKANSL